MDVNEEIVKAWLHNCKKQFTIENVPYPKKGSNYGDIDILAVDANGQFYDYEIKGMFSYSLNRSYYGWLINQIVNIERENQVRSIIGRRAYNRVFVANENFLGKRKGNVKLHHFLKKHGIVVITLETVIKDLVSSATSEGPKCDSQVMQTIRWLKEFGWIK